jgi:hypothetical protein
MILFRPLGVDRRSSADSRRRPSGGPLDTISA